jgi:hypothetical protein
MKPRAAKKIFRAAKVTDFNHIDDLFVTGIVRHRYA